MARHKDRWQGTPFSYGPTYENGKIVGFHLVVRADDRTDSGRFVQIPMSDRTVESLRNAMTEHLARDRSKEGTP